MTTQINARLFPDPETPRGLMHTVLARIASARRRAAALRLTALGFGLLISGALLVPAFQYAAHEFYASGFYEYLRLAFSDSAALSHWQELSLSLFESLPSLAILILTASLAVFAWSLKRTIANVRIAMRPLQFA